MNEIKLVVRTPGPQHAALEMSLSEYLSEHLDKLQPMSVGRCIRFRLPNVVSYLVERMANADIANRLSQGQPVVHRDDDGAILVLPEPVQVDITFEGDAVVKAAGLTPKPKAKKRTRKSASDPSLQAEIEALLGKGELRLQPHQERVAKILDRGDGITMKSRSHASGAARRQLLAYAKSRAIPTCGLCGGGGIVHQQQIVDVPIERFCECLLESR